MSTEEWIASFVLPLAIVALLVVVQANREKIGEILELAEKAKKVDEYLGFFAWFFTWGGWYILLFLAWIVLIILSWLLGSN
jgi:hypothetical protein